MNRNTIPFGPIMLWSGWTIYLAAAIINSR